MARSYSPEYKSTLAQVSGQETPLVLLEINHIDLPSPIRVVNDTLDITSNDNEYLAFPFQCTLPDDFENQLPKATITIGNVSKDIMFWLEESGGGIGATATFTQIMRSRPNQIEWTITMTLFNIAATNQEISAELGFDNLFAKPAILLKYRPTTSPGLF